MLQQTQVSRVLGKYEAFLKKFPNFSALASAPLGEILMTWQGLGYNRRALALKKCAKIILDVHKGVLPQEIDVLDGLPGIGKYTAGAIAVFSFQIPAICIETNIRRVFLHFFFPRKKQVRDEEIERLIRKTLDHKNPREWYWALMDYGAMLGKSPARNPNRKSASYRTQPPFKNSSREMRGKIIKLLTERHALSEYNLRQAIGISKERLSGLLVDLCREGFLLKRRKIYVLG